MKNWIHIATASVFDQYGNLICRIKRPTCVNSIQSARYVAELSARETRDLYCITSGLEFYVTVSVFSLARKTYVYCNKLRYASVLALL